MRYCSLTCYKCEAHAECAEGFYKAEFTTAMKEKVADPAERQRMAATLQRFEEEAADDNTYSEDQIQLKESLAERIQGLDLDAEDGIAQVWERLTPQEQADFRNKQKLATLLVEWRPWWLDVTSKPSVQEIDSEDDVNSGSEEMLARREVAEPPPLEQDVPKFGTMLRGKQPAKELVYNMLDLVYTYVYICRRYNGEIDHMFTTQECAEALLEVSPVLGSNAA